MGFFSSKKPTAQYRLIVNFEPNSVGLGLTLAESQTIEYIDRQYLHYGKRPSIKIMQSKISSLYRSMMNNGVLRHLKDGKISSILCIHSSAWSIAETHTVDLQFQKPTRLDEKLIVDSVHRHRSVGINNTSLENLELVHHRMQRIKLNGYYTDSPWGKVAQNVSCDLIEGYVDIMMKGFIDEELSRYSENIIHIPEGFVVINAARQVIPDMHDALIVHIGGETTEIMYADKEYLRQSASTPSGISNLMRATAEFVHGDESLAFSHITMSAKGYRIPTKKEQAAISNSIDEWRSDFMKALQAVCGQNVPEHIYFFSAVHSMSIAQHMLDHKIISAWSGKKHECQRLFGKKSFQHDFMIAAGALYVVE